MSSFTPHPMFACNVTFLGGVNIVDGGEGGGRFILMLCGWQLLLDLLT